MFTDFLNRLVKIKVIQYDNHLKSFRKLFPDCQIGKNKGDSI